MQDLIGPKLPKWPFYLGDALLLFCAYFIYAQSKLPMGFLEMSFAVGCVAGGAVLAITPFLLEYRAVVKLAEAGALTAVVAQIQNLENIATQINGATGRWQNVQDAADNTLAAAKGIAERMAAEVAAFTEFMQRINDSEKATLRLESEKMRRAEGDWIQVLMRVLDHVYALHKGALRSGQPNLIEQLGHFQDACRDAARRVGLASFAPDGAEPFDGQCHQLADGDSKLAAGAVIGETIAAGYTLQGRLIRPALVRLRDNGAEGAEASNSTRAADLGNQSQLPLEAPDANPD